MQANKGIRMIRDPTLNYWNCKDSEFAVSTAEIQLSDGPRPLSTKLSLFDPPGLFKPEIAKQIPGDSAVSSSYCLSKQVGLRSKSALPFTGLAVFRPTPPTSNFGSLVVKKSKAMSIVLYNVGTKPIHYVTLQPENKVFPVSTIPGGIFPGLKVVMKVPGQGIMIGMRSATFRTTVKEVNENTIELVIPVEVNFIERNETDVEVRPEMITITE
jgi:hypothetical protein